MVTLIATVHIIACLLLIALVLLQGPKSNNPGAMFGGGGSNTVLGATGATTVLQKLTRWAAIIFGTCALLLSLASRQESRSVLDTLPASTGAAPTSMQDAAPAAAPPGAAVPDATGSTGSTGVTAPASTAPSGNK
jgi:preprotein translocase subunit SecG